jgi:hypothetical protein
MRLKDSRNFTTGKKLFYTSYACPDLFRMMSIIINIARPGIFILISNLRSYSLEKQNSFPDFLFS